jgi:hypothetical protein
LTEDDAGAWAEVQSILATGGCAEISGCAYVGLPTTCQQGTPLYVNSCKRIDCPPGTNCPDRLNIAGVDINLKGPITLEGGCFVLTDNAGVKYELEMDENYPNAWNKVGTIQKESECAQIDGCAYSGMPTKCSGSSMPVYVKSCQEAACAPSTPASVTKESVKPIVPAKNQSNVEVKKKNASLTKNQSGLEMH